MRKKILPIITIVMMVLFGACSNEALLEDASQDSNYKGEEGTIRVIASVPEKPASRVALEQSGRDISLSWESEDVVEFVFVQGSIEKKSNATVSTISENGKSATLDIVIPDGIDKNQLFNLYGVYGGSLSPDDITKVLLPSSSSVGNTLDDIKSNVILHSVSSDIDLTTNTPISISFNHLGSLLSVSLKNIGTDKSFDLIDFSKIRLVPVNGETNWAYNLGVGDKTYDLVNETFLDIDSDNGDFISFNNIKDNKLLIDSTITFWGWYPILPDKQWPELELQLINSEDEVITTTVNTKAAKTPHAGKSYYILAQYGGPSSIIYNDTEVWSGSQLTFTGESFINEHILTPESYGALSRGELLDEIQKASITKLIVKGYLDEDDFKVIKLEMPNLTHLDLREATLKNNALPDQAIGGQGRTNVNQINHNPSAYNYNRKIHTLYLPTNLKSIGKHAFRNCRLVTGSWDLPSGLTSIGAGAFYNAFNPYGSVLGYGGKLIIPEGITVIESEAFGYGRFNEVVIGENITKIGSKAFLKCNQITDEIVIPDNITEIGFEAFDDCKNLPALKFESTTPPEIIFGSGNNNKLASPWTIIKVPSGAKSAYIDAGYGEQNTLEEY